MELEERVGEVENRLTKLETAQPFLNDIIERNTRSYESLVETMCEMKDTMVEMKVQMVEQTNKIEAQGQAIAEVRSDFESSNQKLNDKISKIEEKSQFDIMGFFKSNFPWIVVILGLGIAYASQYVNL